MKELKVDMDKLVKRVYFKIANWHNNEEELDPEQMKVRLIGLSSEIIENVIETAFSQQKKEIRTEDNRVNDSGLLNGLNINLDNIKNGKK